MRPEHRGSLPGPQTDRSQLTARFLSQKLLPQALQAILPRRIFQSARASRRSHTPSSPEKHAAGHLPSPNPGRPQVRRNSSTAWLLLAQLILEFRFARATDRDDQVAQEIFPVHAIVLSALRNEQAEFPRLRKTARALHSIKISAGKLLRILWKKEV